MSLTGDLSIRWHNTRGLTFSMSPDSSEGAALINEWIQAGVIGAVKQVHVWTNRPIWPQGIPRPSKPAVTADAPAAGSGSSWTSRGVNKTLASAMDGDYSPPAGLDWDLFLGPAPEVQYHPIYHPFNWRGWADWGTGRSAIWART